MFEFEKEFHTILKSLHEIDALRHLILIGSWVLLVYLENYRIPRLTFTTSDVDFTIIRPHEPVKKSNPSIHKQLTEIGYVPHRSPVTQSEKYIPALESKKNKLSIEFLCEPGRIVKAPYRVKGFGIIATPLRYQRVLHENAITLAYKGITVNVPKPAFWAAHKIAMSQLRSGEQAELKKMKDLDGARIIVNFLGYEDVMGAAQCYKGKFLSLFQRGWRTYQSRFPEEPETDSNHG